MSKKEQLFWCIVMFLIAAVCAVSCSAVGSNHDTKIQDGGVQYVGITYWDLYWSGLILLGILGVLYYLREAMKYGLHPMRILKGIRK